MPHKLEFANLLSNEQAIPARAATRTLNESEFLIKADRVHADTSQLGGRTDVHRFCHALRINPGVMSRVKRESSNPKAGCIWVQGSLDIVRTLPHETRIRAPDIEQMRHTVGLR